MRAALERVWLIVPEQHTIVEAQIQGRGTQAQPRMCLQRTSKQLESCTSLKREMPTCEEQCISSAISLALSIDLKSYIPNSRVPASSNTPCKSPRSAAILLACASLLCAGVTAREWDQPHLHTPGICACWGQGRSSLAKQPGASEADREACEGRGGRSAPQSLA